MMLIKNECSKEPLRSKSQRRPFFQIPSNGVTWNDGVTWNKKKVLLPAVIALPIITLKIQSIPFWTAVRKYYSRF